MLVSFGGFAKCSSHFINKLTHTNPLELYGKLSLTLFSSSILINTIKKEMMLSIDQSHSPSSDDPNLLGNGPD